MKEASNCLAADLHTAAVFHLMRVVNIGLRKLAEHWGVVDIGGKALEYCGDGQIIAKIEGLIKDRQEAMATVTHDEKWEKETALYRGLMVDCRYFKDVDRDSTAHARKTYKEPGALDVFEHVKDFMLRVTQIK